MNCTVCNQGRDVVSALVRGVYYSHICTNCIAAKEPHGSVSSGYQGFDRRRQYEDNAQDTVQPYDAAGNPRPEFYRLYPDAAAKTFTKEEITRVRSKL